MAITELSYKRTWTSPADFPTVEPDEAKVRADLQYHPDAIKKYINSTLVPTLNDLTVAKHSHLNKRLLDSITEEAVKDSFGAAPLVVAVSNASGQYEVDKAYADILSAVRANRRIVLLVSGQKCDAVRASTDAAGVHLHCNNFGPTADARSTAVEGVTVTISAAGAVSVETSSERFSDYRKVEDSYNKTEIDTKFAPQFLLTITGTKESPIFDKTYGELWAAASAKRPIYVYDLVDRADPTLYCAAVSIVQTGNKPDIILQCSNVSYQGWAASLYLCFSSGGDAPERTFVSRHLFDEPADYIVARGETGRWSWEKYASGRAVCWGDITGGSPVAVTRAWGSMYYGSWMGETTIAQDRKYPFEFIDAPIVTATVAPGIGMDCLLCNDTVSNAGDPTGKNYAPAFCFVRPEQGTANNPSVHYIVRGHWR